jgi:hypothetical protein
MSSFLFETITADEIFPSSGLYFKGSFDIYLHCNISLCFSNRFDSDSNFSILSI